MSPKTRTLIASYVVPIVVLIILFVVVVQLPQDAGVQTYPEVQELAGTNWSFQKYSDYLRELSEKRGAEYAYEVLKRAAFPPGTDLHLLGHLVGDMLYKEKGIDGVRFCTPDFRNACSHSVVIGILNEHGEASLPEIADTCKRAPGGKGAYTMCFHGLGHGVLAYTGYDLKRAVPMCEKVGTEAYGKREYVECVGGTIMEMIGGVHDRQAWEKQVGTYFKESDPLYPCSADFMPAEVRQICYVHLTPHLFVAAGGDLGRMDPAIFPKAFSYCDALPENDLPLRSACYGGFGKEFTVIAQNRDVRDIGSMDEASLHNVRAWCALAGDTFGEGACNASALSSLYWGGENNPNASFTYCEIAEGEARRACFEQLAFQVNYYALDGKAKEALCARIPNEFRGRCGVTP